MTVMIILQGQEALFSSDDSVYWLHSYNRPSATQETDNDPVVTMKAADQHTAYSNYSLFCFQQIWLLPVPLLSAGLGVYFKGI